jgi:hypothetical protein
MNGLDVDKDTFIAFSNNDRILVLYDLIKSIAEKPVCIPEGCSGIKGLWTHVKIQWWWLAAISVGILGAAFFIIRSA